MVDDKTNDYIQTIQVAYPELVIHAAHCDDREGQYNDIVFINEDIVFRFPKFDEGIATVGNEVAILSRIQGRTRLPVPNPAFIQLEPAILGQVFMGYHMLPGRPLWRPLFESITDEAVLARLAGQLAEFLKELHNIPVAELGNGWPVLDRPGEWADLLEDFRWHLFPLMWPDARQQVEVDFAAYLADEALHNFRPALRHGDFGTGNLLYDPQREVISGIVDFGFAGIGDPALDIAAAMGFGPAFFAHYAAVYPEVEAMLPRAQFYRGTYPLQAALYGFKNGDRSEFESGIATYV